MYSSLASLAQSLAADDKPPNASGKEEYVNAQHQRGRNIGPQQKANIKADEEELGGENHHQRLAHGETCRHAEVVDVRLVGMKHALAVDKARERYTD